MCVTVCVCVCARVCVCACMCCELCVGCMCGGVSVRGWVINRMKSDYIICDVMLSINTVTILLEQVSTPTVPGTMPRVPISMPIIPVTIQYQ